MAEIAPVRRTFFAPIVMRRLSERFVSFGEPTSQPKRFVSLAEVVPQARRNNGMCLRNWYRELPTQRPSFGAHMKQMFTKRHLSRLASIWILSETLKLPFARSHGTHFGLRIDIKSARIVIAAGFSVNEDQAPRYKTVELRPAFVHPIPHECFIAMLFQPLFRLPNRHGAQLVAQRPRCFISLGTALLIRNGAPEHMDIRVVRGAHVWRDVDIETGQIRIGIEEIVEILTP